MEGVRRDSSHWVLGSPNFFFCFWNYFAFYLHYILRIVKLTHTQCRKCTDRFVSFSICFPFILFLLGIEPMPLAVNGQSPNHQITKKFPKFSFPLPHLFPSHTPFFFLTLSWFKLVFPLKVFNVIIFSGTSQSFKILLKLPPFARGREHTFPFPTPHLTLQVLWLVLLLLLSGSLLSE